MSETLIRSVELPEALHLRDDGRTVDGLIVPWNTPADVIDVTATGVRKYREGFLSTSFDQMMREGRKRGNFGFMRLKIDHDDATDRIAGFARTVEVGEQGARAEFRLYRGSNLELFQSMIEESHDGLSVEFVDLAKPLERDGVTWRTQVWVSGVATTPEPAYANAKVLAMRSDDAPSSVETPVLDELNAWLASQ